MSEFKDFIPIFSIIGSGIFGSAIAWITAHYSFKRINHEDIVKWKRSRIEKLETIYTSLIACINKMINNVINQRNNSEIDFETIQSQVDLLGTPEVIALLNDWIERYNDWSINCLKGSPKPIDGTNQVIISSNQAPYRNKAKELYPEVHSASNKLINACRDHLENLLNVN